jgi:hypothetical protein
MSYNKQAIAEKLPIPNGGFLRRNGGKKGGRQQNSCSNQSEVTTLNQMKNHIYCWYLGFNMRLGFGGVSDPIHQWCCVSRTGSQWC